MKSITMSKGFVAYVDDDLFDYLNQFTWCYHEGRCGTVYARGQVHGQHTYMHHLIIGHPPPGFVVDHINHCGQDNQRANLRFVQVVDNNIHRRLNKNNTSGHKGISWNAAKQGWEVKVGVAYKTIHLGRFKTIEEALQAKAAHEQISIL